MSTKNHCQTKCEWQHGTQPSAVAGMAFWNLFLAGVEACVPLSKNPLPNTMRMAIGTQPSAVAARLSEIYPLQAWKPAYLKIKTRCQTECGWQREI